MLVLELALNRVHVGGGGRGVQGRACGGHAGMGSKPMLDVTGLEVQDEAAAEKC